MFNAMAFNAGAAFRPPKAVHIIGMGNKGRPCSKRPSFEPVPRGGTPVATWPVCLHIHQDALNVISIQQVDLTVIN